MIFNFRRGRDYPRRDVRWAFHRARRAAGIADFRAQMLDMHYGHLSPDHKRIATEIYGAARGAGRL